jgi:hypothetical protein
MKRTFTAPRLLLGARSLSGVSRATRDRMIELAARYHGPESLAVTLSKALDAGAEGVLASPSPALRAALRELKRTVPIAAVLPTLDEHERFEVEPSLEALIHERSPNAGFGAKWRARMAGLGAGGDWSRLVPKLIELESGAVRRRELCAVVLADPIADVALAAGHAKLFSRFIDFVHRRFRVPAGIETCNLGVLLASLAEWEIAPDFIVGPVNPAGLGMKPDRDTVLAALRRSQVPVLGSELRAGGTVSLAEGARFALESGARGLVPDLVDLDDVASELKTLAG